MPLAALALTLGCGSASGDPDAGLLVPVAKDGAEADSSVSSPDAGAPDAAAPDATFPDAAPLPDSDGDGIPDEEDVLPATPNPALFIDAFDSVAPEWLFTSNAIRVEPAVGALRVPMPEPFVREGWLGVQSWYDVLIRTRLRVTRRGPAAEVGSGRAGVLARIQQVTPDRYLLCGVDVRDGMVFISEHNGGGAAGDTLVSAPAAVAIGDWVNIRFAIQGTVLRCRVAGIDLRADSNLFVSGSAGVRAFDTAFDADWFEVYSL